MSNLHATGLPVYLTVCSLASVRTFSLTFVPKAISRSVPKSVFLIVLLKRAVPNEELRKTVAHKVDLFKTLLTLSCLASVGGCQIALSKPVVQIL